MKQATVFPILLFCIAAFIACVKQAEAQGSVDTDREALVALYDATDGDNWTYNTNWKSDKPLDQWYGIGQDNKGGVNLINLFNNQLTGSIPSELGNLVNLWGLFIYSNNLTGPIPPELGNLTSLGILNLSFNNLTGSIPSELGNLVNLRRLIIYINNLTGPIPPELGNLTNLETLNLSSNNLTGSIPSELGNLTNLETLNLPFNNLTGSIPSELGNLTNLEILNLNDNNLTGSIPPELGNLTNLEILNLNDNNLTGSIPPELGNLTNLKELGLTDNNLTGSIPPAVCNLFPGGGIALSVVGNVGLVNNCFQAPIPDEFSNNERRHFMFRGENVEFILLQENEYGIIWMSIDIFRSGYVSVEEIQASLNYLFTSILIDSTKGILEYTRDLLGTVVKNPRIGERKIDIFIHIFHAHHYAGLHFNAITYSNFNDSVLINQITRIRHYVGIIAHEYVHSIHLAYGGSIDFFLEGLSEWVRCGILNEKNMHNPLDNLLCTAFFIEYRNKPLFQPRPFLYEQALIFTAYLAQRIGMENMKYLIQLCKPGGVCDANNPDDGDWYRGIDRIDGMDSALSLINPDITLQKIILDYHTTNLVNDPSIILNGIEYGYKAIKYDLKIHPNIIVDFHNNSFSQKTIELLPGGVDYIAYTNTSNLHFAIDTNNKQLTLLRLFKEKGDTKELVDIDRNVDEYMVSGDYDRVTLIAVHGNPKPDQPDITLNISATQNYGVATENEELPTAFSLEQNYPNPFNPSTSIGWSQPQAAQVRLSVYNMLGQEVATLVDDFRPAGIHEIRLDALNWTSGVYVYVLEAGEKTFTQRMVLLK